jgi:hypothetical protein
MSTRSQLDKKIENQITRIFEVEQILMQEKAFLAGLQEALKVLPKDDNAHSGRPVDQILRPGSDMAKAREYLQSTGKPMYITDILTGIGKEITQKTRTSIGGSLGNYSRKNLIFKRTAPNTYGLIEFGTPSPPPDGPAPDEAELPEDFGVSD